MLPTKCYFHRIMALLKNYKVMLVTLVKSTGISKIVWFKTIFCIDWNDLPHIGTGVWTNDVKYICKNDCIMFRWATIFISFYWRDIKFPRSGRLCSSKTYALYWYLRMVPDLNGACIFVLQEEVLYVECSLSSAVNPTQPYFIGFDRPTKKLEHMKDAVTPLFSSKCYL